jgi:hypothetical protein
VRSQQKYAACTSFFGCTAVEKPVIRIAYEFDCRLVRISNVHRPLCRFQNPKTAPFPN